MRKLITALVMIMALGFTVPAMAQTRPAPDAETSAVPINADMVGAGVLALATSSGLLNLYEAGSQILQSRRLLKHWKLGLASRFWLSLALPFLVAFTGRTPSSTS